MAARAPKRTAQQRRRLILETAQAMFAASNYTRVSTAELAKAAGISEPALYRYFPSKKDLFISTIKTAGKRLLDIWERLAGELIDPLEIIRAIGRGYYYHLRSHSPVMKLLFQAISEADDEDIRQALRDNFAAFIRFLEENIEEGKRHGVIRQDVNPGVAAWQFMAFGLALDLVHLLGLDEKLSRNHAEEWGELYLDSIREGAPGGAKAASRAVTKGFDRYMVEDWRELYLGSIEEGDSWWRLGERFPRF
jgi:TetR/AcrR family transcriptional regulator